MIALLCPSRNRPNKFRNMVCSVIKTTTEPITIYCMVQLPEDHKSYTHGVMGNVTVKQLQLEIDVFDTIVPTVHLWNTLAETAKKDGHKLFMLASDDMIFHDKGWDKALIKDYGEGKVHVYALQDSRDIDGYPHPIVSREYMDVMGYFLPPLFLHWYVDSWTVEIAKSCDQFTHLDDYLLVHDKPIRRKDADETHTFIRKLGWHKRDKHVANTCNAFLGIEKERLKKALT